MSFEMNMTASRYFQPSSCFILLLIGWLAFTAQPAAAADNKDYQIGDKLSAPVPGKAKTKPMPSATATVAYKEKTWDDLMPRNWDPMASLKGLKLDKLEDGDPRAIEALEKIREAWRSAPVEPALNGERIRIPGFVIPLEKSGNKVREFLLVPYFGACIHTPPPPPNQIIHVSSSKPIANMRTMDTMWVSGIMHIGNVNTEMGQAGYQLKAEWVVPYP
jgi:uncharacterized protein